MLPSKAQLYVIVVQAIRPMLVLLTMKIILFKYMKFTEEENINIMALIKIILSQNFNITRPRKLAKIIILSSWMLSFIIIKIYYCTKLWNFMTFSEYGRTIETIRSTIS